jgi:hypothetical protein
MKRNVFAVVVAGLALGGAVAFAHHHFGIDDRYWKQPDVVHVGRNAPQDDGQSTSSYGNPFNSSDCA